MYAYIFVYMCCTCVRARAYVCKFHICLNTLCKYYYVLVIYTTYYSVRYLNELIEIEFILPLYVSKATAYIFQ